MKWQAKWVYSTTLQIKFASQGAQVNRRVANERRLKYFTPQECEGGAFLSVAERFYQQGVKDLLFFLSAWAGKMNQILQSDWFRERAEFSDLDRSQRNVNNKKFVMGF